MNADFDSVIPKVESVSKKVGNLSIGVEKMPNAESRGLVVNGESVLVLKVLVGFARKELKENAE